MATATGSIYIWVGVYEDSESQRWVDKQDCGTCPPVVAKLLGSGSQTFKIAEVKSILRGTPNTRLEFAPLDTAVDTADAITKGNALVISLANGAESILKYWFVSEMKIEVATPATS